MVHTLTPSPAAKHPHTPSHSHTKLTHKNQVLLSPNTTNCVSLFRWVERERQREREGGSTWCWWMDPDLLQKIHKRNEAYKREAGEAMASAWTKQEWVYCLLSIFLAYTQMHNTPPPPPPLSLSLSLSLSLRFPLYTHTPAHAHRHTHSLSLTHTLTLMQMQTHKQHTQAHIHLLHTYIYTVMPILPLLTIAPSHTPSFSLFHNTTVLSLYNILCVPPYTTYVYYTYTDSSE